MNLRRVAPFALSGAFLVVGAATLPAAPPPEHPEHPEHPTAQKKISVDDLEKAIQEKVSEKSKADGGTFRLPDDVLHKTWELELVRVHRDKLTRLEDGTYFACVDMKEKGGKDVVDVDFFLKESDGKLAFSDMAVHKVNGAPRYNWEKKGDRWVKTPA
jgi:hypothetical protein